MLTTMVATRGPRFWFPLIVAVSLAMFAVGLVTGSGALRAPAAFDPSPGGAVAGAVRSAPQTAGGAVDSMSNAAWEALYGPTAATWGVSRATSDSMSNAAWEALYGPTAATWGIHPGVTSNK